MLVITKVGAHLTAGASHHHVHLPHEAIPELLLSFSSTLRSLAFIQFWSGFCEGASLPTPRYFRSGGVALQASPETVRRALSLFSGEVCVRV